MTQRSLKRILIIIAHNDDQRNRILAGIGQYSQIVGDWIVGVQDPSEENLNKFRGLKIDGVINASHPGFIQTLRDKVGAPIVNANTMHPDVPSIILKAEMIAQKAADYFCLNGFQHFAFVGRGTPGSNLIAEHYQPLVRGKLHHFVSSESIHSIAYQKELCAWLSSLPKPVALFVPTDDLARSVCQRCLEADIKVPEEISILGVNNAMPLANLTHPSLSSIDLPMELLGFEAASILDQLMKGHPPSQWVTELEPLDVVVRGSSDITAVNDALVRDAMYRIRQDIVASFNIDALAAALGVSRSKLEKRFKAATGKTPFGAARQVQMEKVRSWLRDSDLSIEQIADKMHFASASHLSTTFSKEFGQPPGAYRRRYRKSNA